MLLPAGHLVLCMQRETNICVCCTCRATPGSHPLLSASPASALASCWAAALHLMATYWGGIPVDSPVLHATRAQAAASGLLLQVTDCCLDHAFLLSWNTPACLPAACLLALPACLGWPL